jgi:hypothetical protein
MADPVIMVRFPAGGRKLLSLLIIVQTGSGSTNFPIQWVPETLVEGVKHSGRETDNSQPPGVEVKNAMRYTYTS